MKLQLEQAEIEQAVREYVANQGIKVEGKSLALKFTMTRGESGLIADLSIEDAAPAASATKKPARVGTVGAAIANQPASQPVVAAVNKLPATAVAVEAPAEDTSETLSVVERAEQDEVGQGNATPVVEAKPATTTSLFG